MIDKGLSDALLEAIADDYTGLWETIHIVARHHNRAVEEPVLKEDVLDAIQELLDQGSIRAGSVEVDGTFTPWTLSSDASMTRIREEWSKLGRQPNIGDIVWLDTAEGVD